MHPAFKFCQIKLGQDQESTCNMDKLASNWQNFDQVGLRRLTWLDLAWRLKFAFRLRPL